MKQTIYKGFLLINSMKISEQIQEILEMPEGWLEYSNYKLGEKYDKTELDWLKNMLVKYTTVIEPKIYPVEPNDINIEWTGNNRNFTLKINMKDRVGIFYAGEFDTVNSGEKRLDLTKTASWKFITSIINSKKWKHNAWDKEPMEIIELTNHTVKDKTSMEVIQ